MNNRKLAAILSIIGVHYFYLNKIGTALLYWLMIWTPIGWIWWAVDICRFMSMNETEFNFKYNRGQYYLFSSSNIYDRKYLLSEYLNSVQNENVKKFMEQCIETIPNYWFQVPASSTGKYHPNYALGYGGLMRHTIALLRFFERLVRNDIFSKKFTSKELDLLRVACLMHDSRKSGDDNDFRKSKYTKPNHPLLAADVVRSIQTNYITNEEKELIANAIESHMGQWNDNGNLPLPTNKYRRIVHIVDYLAATKGCELIF